MAPSPHRDAEVFEESLNRVGPTICVATDGVHRNLDSVVVAIDGISLPILFVVLMLEPAFKVMRRVLKPL
jgi:hypothetical protein